MSFFSLPYTNGSSLLMRFCPITIPVQTFCVRNTCRSLDVQPTQYLLDSTLNPGNRQQSLYILKSQSTYFLPLVVTGISGHSSTTAGTCRALSAFLTATLILVTSSGVMECPSAILRNKTTVSSSSVSLRRPMHNASATSSAKCSKTTL